MNDALCLTQTGPVPSPPCLELVGQFQGEGQSWQNAWYDHCDYFDTVFPERERSPGVQVVDVADPAHPRLTANLTTPAMLGPGSR